MRCAFINTILPSRHVEMNLTVMIHRLSGTVYQLFVAISPTLCLDSAILGRVPCWWHISFLTSSRSLRWWIGRVGMRWRVATGVPVRALVRLYLHGWSRFRFCSYFRRFRSMAVVLKWCGTLDQYNRSRQNNAGVAEAWPKRYLRQSQHL